MQSTKFINNTHCWSKDFKYLVTDAISCDKASYSWQVPLLIGEGSSSGFTLKANLN